MTGKHSTTNRPELASLLISSLETLRERPGLAPVISTLILDMHTAISAEWARANVAANRHDELLTKLELVWVGNDDYGDLSDVIRDERSRPIA